MNRLHDTQQQFASFVFQQTQLAPDDIIANGISPERRLAIYRNNTRAGLTEALRNVYTVVDKLVGSAFFNRLAEKYIQQYPPSSACLLDYGSHFPELITNFADASSLHYLSDTARLEWYWHEAYHEAEAQPLELTVLGQLDPIEYNRVAFRLHPSTRLMVSDYPILSIWESNQPDFIGQELIDVNAGGCHLLLFRPDWQVEIIDLSAAEYQFLNLLASGKTLSQTVSQILTNYTDMDVQLFLQKCLLEGLLIDFYII